MKGKILVHRKAIMKVHQMMEESRRDFWKEGSRREKREAEKTHRNATAAGSELRSWSTLCDIYEVTTFSSTSHP